MNKKDLIKAYTDLKNSEAPNLWERIEKELDTSELKAESVETKKYPKKTGKFIFGFATITTTAAFAVMIVVLAVSSTLQRPFLPYFSKDTLKSAKDITNQNGMAVNPEYDSQLYATSVPMLPNDEKTISSTQPTHTAAENQNGGSGFPRSYSDLMLADAKTPKLPAVTAHSETLSEYLRKNPFSESAIAKSTDLLIQATVIDAFFIYNDSGEAEAVKYEVLVNEIYYKNINRLQSEYLTIISPIVTENGVWMYPLLIDRTYFLPLSITEDARLQNDTDSSVIAASVYGSDSQIDTDGTGSVLAELIFPYAPQIELSLDGFCVFHSGWTSLINDETRALSDRDVFCGEMLIRSSDGFAKDLTSIIKFLKTVNK